MVINENIGIINYVSETYILRYLSIQNIVLAKPLLVVCNVYIK